MLPTDLGYIVQGGVRDEPLELCRVIRGAVVCDPRVADGELVEPQHIQHSVGGR